MSDEGVDGETKPWKLAVKILVVLALAGNIYLLSQVGLVDKSAEVGVARPEWKLISLVDSSCAACGNLDEILKFVKESSVTITDDEVLDYSSDKAKAGELIEKYGIKKLPILVIQGEYPKDETLKRFWDTFGETINGDFVLKRVQPPYREVATGEIRGLFKVTFLTDSACKTCHEVFAHENAFRNLSMTLTEKETVDSASAAGRALIKKYNITQVPTILVSGDLGEYAAFQLAWKDVGTEEGDGTFIFRDVGSQMGIYRDLRTGKVVEPPKQPDGEALKAKE